MNVRIVEPNEVRLSWPMARRHILSSQRRGPTDMSMEEIRHNCEREDWRLLILDNGRAAAVIRIWDTRLHVVAIGGKLAPKWYLEFFDYLKRIARYVGLTSVTLGGRKGWARLLKPLGFVSIGGPYIGVQIS